MGRTTVTIAVLAVLVLAGACGGGDDVGDETGGDATVPGSDGRLTTQSVDGVGTVLADADGMTLYTNEAEDSGAIKCVAGCVDFWPPLEGEAPEAGIDGVDGTLGEVRRPDGTRQVTLDGRPLYTFSDDRSPGSATGDGFEDDFKGDHFVWHAVTVEAAPSSPPETGDDGGIYGY